MLKVENLCKSYPTFTLDNVSFELQKGYIMGFIGANGAGKTTTLKSMLNLVQADSGKVEILGKDFTENELEIKQQIGFMFGPVNFYTKTTLKKLSGVYKKFFTDWDEELYQSYLAKFNLDESKKVDELSAGMKAKYGIALALSHHAKLIIFDEPTSGLDPVARDELLDIFQDIVEDGEHSILFSTHVTSDLDKCADFIIFIAHGKLMANCTKDQLIDSHALVEGNVDYLDSIKDRLIGYKKHNFGFKGLAKRENLKENEPIEIEVPNLEDIMVYYNKGDKNNEER